MLACRLPIVLVFPLLVLSFGAGEAHAQADTPSHWEYGEGSPLVIVLHGGPYAAHDYLLPEWRRVEAFGSVLFYDQRGCGESRDLPGPSDWQHDVADLETLIREHARGRPVVLAGSSWGAQLALLYALTGWEPVDAVVLTGYPGWSGSKSPRPRDQPPHVQARLDSLEKGLPVAPWSEPDTLTSGRGIGAYLADSIVGERVDGIREAGLFSKYANTRTWPPERELAGIDWPVLILQGDRGGKVPEGGPHLNRLLPHARRVVIRNAAHDPWAADPDAFFGAMEEFLSDVGLLGGGKGDRGAGG